MVRLPSAGISMQKDCQSPDYILLPLISRTPNIYSIGKGFHTFPKEFIANSNDPSNPSLEGVTFHDSSSHRGPEFVHQSPQSEHPPSPE
jgi:hypothetical protein